MIRKRSPVLVVLLLLASFLVLAGISLLDAEAAKREWLGEKLKAFDQQGREALFKLQSKRSKKFQKSATSKQKGCSHQVKQNIKTVFLIFWTSTLSEPPIYYVGFTSFNIHQVETECAVIHALFMLVCLYYRSLNWIFLLCEVCNLLMY